MSDLKNLLKNLLSTKPKMSWADYVRAMTGGWRKEHNYATDEDKYYNIALQAGYKVARQGAYTQQATQQTSNHPNYTTTNSPIFGAIPAGGWGSLAGTAAPWLGVGTAGSTIGTTVAPGDFIDPTSLAAKERLENAERAYRELATVHGNLVDRASSAEARLVELNREMIEDHALREFLLENYPDVLKEFAEVRRTFWEMTR